MNEWIGCKIGNHLIADHPEIKKHLKKYVNESKITVIPYSADVINDADFSLIEHLNIKSKKFFSVVARIEPENNILPIIKAFSAKKRSVNLLVLGNIDRNKEYDISILNAASDEVIFTGAIYDRKIVQAIRYHSIAYIHGHSVGGTNPSLVEALGANNAIIAYNNKFNKWVAGKENQYFTDETQLDNIISEVLEKPQLLEKMQQESKKQFTENFTYKKIMDNYFEIIGLFYPE